MCGRPQATVQDRKTGYEHYWEVVRLQEGKPFTVRDVYNKSADNDHRQIRTYLNALAKAGYLTVTSKPASHPGATANCYQQVAGKDPLEAPRLRKDGTELPPMKNKLLWKSMRIMGAFSLQDLLLTTFKEKAAKHREHTRKYLRFLCEAGYLSGDVKQGFTLLPHMNTGPKPPVIQKTLHVYDPNRQEVVWTGEVKDEQSQ